MENLFDLLIILFILYALLAPLFRRRTPPPRKHPETYEPETYQEPVEEKSSQDILREIEELFGYKAEEPEPITESGSDEEFLQFEPEQIPVQKLPEQKFEEKVVQKTPSQTIEEKIHQDFLIEAYAYEATLPDIDIDEFDYSKLDAYNVETKNVVKAEKTFKLELNNLDDFKKAVIYKEIFDTPIALRMRNIKWQRNIY